MTADIQSDSLHWWRRRPTEIRMLSLSETSYNRGNDIQSSISPAIVAFPIFLRGILSDIIVEYLDASGETDLTL